MGSIISFDLFTFIHFTWGHTWWCLELLLFLHLGIKYDGLKDAWDLNKSCHRSGKHWTKVNCVQGQHPICILLLHPTFENFIRNIFSQKYLAKSCDTSITSLSWLSLSSHLYLYNQGDAGNSLISLAYKVVNISYLWCRIK